MLAWCKEGSWVPGVVVKDCIGQVADDLGDDVPFKGARCAAKGKVKHDDA